MKKTLGILAFMFLMSSANSALAELWKCTGQEGRATYPPIDLSSSGLQVDCKLISPDTPEEAARKRGREIMRLRCDFWDGTVQVGRNYEISEREKSMSFYTKEYVRADGTKYVGHYIAFGVDEMAASLKESDQFLEIANLPEPSKAPVEMLGMWNSYDVKIDRFTGVAALNETTLFSKANAQKVGMNLAMVSFKGRCSKVDAATRKF